MIYTVPLGRHCGLTVPRLCMGTMNIGEPGRGHQGDWTLGIDDARPLFKAAIDRGICYFDCADIYGLGAGERVVGELLRELLPRDRYMIATKIAMPSGRGPNQGGLSRKRVLEGIDGCLKRLGLDHIDKLVIHRHPHGVPGYSSVPIEETLQALHDVVKAGKARYIGASSMYAWQFAKMLHTSRANGWARFVSMQNYVNLLYREEEREMLPLCAAEGIGVIPWSPIARGRLARPWDAQTERSRTDEFGSKLFAHTQDADRAVVERVAEVAAQRGVPMARVALAWVLAKPMITAPIVGASRPGHLDDALAALDLKLTADEIARLEEPYVPHAVVGFA